METFYVIFFAALAGVCVLLETQPSLTQPRRADKASLPAPPEAFRRFRRNYLIVYSLAMGMLYPHFMSFLLLPLSL